MTDKPITVLGINPGTKYLAISVFRGPELREWYIKSFKGTWSEEKMQSILASVAGLISWYRADALAIKRLHPARTSKGLDLLTKTIRNEAGHRGLKVRQYSVTQIETAFCEGARMNKKIMADKVVAKYPVLWADLDKEKSHKNPYYLRLFEAVALGSICHNDLDTACGGK
jgi:hypothetical protein